MRTTKPGGLLTTLGEGLIKGVILQPTDDV
jgi:hypothetical protein